MSTPTESEILIRFIESVRVAAECARQFGHSRKDSRWLKVNRQLEATIEICGEMARRRISAS